MKSRIAALALAAAVVLGASGCNLISPQDTTIKYDPSDGVSADVGVLALRNILLISNDGELGNLVFTAWNPSSETIPLGVQYRTAEGERVTVQIELGQGSHSFGFGDNPQLVLADLGVAPGGLAELYFQYGAEPGALRKVPVLDTCLPEYGALTPIPPIEILPEEIEGEDPFAQHEAGTESAGDGAAHESGAPAGDAGEGTVEPEPLVAPEPPVDLCTVPDIDSGSDH